MMILLISLLIFSGISPLFANKLVGVNVLEILKSKHASCDLRNFVESIDKSDDEYQILIHDLRKYCSTSKSSTLYSLLCRMILIELEIACELPVNFRPTPIRYSILSTSSQICSMNKIELINNWIWQKLTSDEKEEIGPTPIYLCPILSGSNSTSRLARFFYKIAPRIRRADIRNNGQLDNKDLGNSVFNKIQIVGDISLKKTNKTKGTLFELDELAIMKKNKTLEILNQTDENSRNKINPVREPRESSTNQTNNNKISVDRAEEIKRNRRGGDQEQADSKKIDGRELNPPNELKKDEGAPLGRGGENPEREQVNERPKPKALDVEAVFKANDDEEKNWVEGKHNADQPENRLQNNIKRFPRLKLDHNPFNLPQIFRKKNPLKSKSTNHLNGDDDDDLTDHFITLLLVFILCIIIFYLILRNKNKVLGLIVEGCKRKRGSYNRRIRLSQSSQI